MSEPVRVAVTGAAGQIGYAILFRIASGQMLGPDTPVALSLLEIPDAVKAAEGTAMELDDCAFPLLRSIDIHDDPNQAFDGANVALLIGARPRTKGMERADLLEANGKIFEPQGKALNSGAADDIKVLVVGNPANTNCLIARSHAPDIPSERFTAMTRLDHNRALTQLAKKVGAQVTDITDMAVWGNHSPTMYPDLFNAKVERRDRGGEGRRRTGSRTTSCRRSASAAQRSSRRAARRARRRRRTRRSTTCTTGSTARTASGSRWQSSPTAPTASTRASCRRSPITCESGEWSIVEGVELTDFSKEKIDATVDELRGERDSVKELQLV